MSTADTDKTYVLNHEIEMIDGETQSLEQYKGRVVMFVNVASKCGYTKQYEQLEAIYREYKDRGFVVIGFPANDFGAQEPGTNEEIAEFCSSTFDVTFPMAAKIHVKGDEVAPLYKQLAEQAPPIGGELGWNFTKFLVAKDGRVSDRFDTKISPDDPAVIAAIEELLGSD
ncbi:MAG: glutathione peroxidase [Phycisphaerales bacterium]|nr:glutathione peroxidase [Phycisphaerales bacterium]